MPVERSKCGSFDGKNAGHATNVCLHLLLPEPTTRILITILARSNLFCLTADLFNGVGIHSSLPAFLLLLFGIRVPVDYYL